LLLCLFVAIGVPRSAGAYLGTVDDHPAGAHEGLHGAVNRWQGDAEGLRDRPPRKRTEARQQV
jgi:hypothetical protein